jgi:hypothetical protein
VVTAAQEAAPNSTGAENEIHSDDERHEARFRGICQAVEGGSSGECGFHAHIQRRTKGFGNIRRLKAWVASEFVPSSVITSTAAKEYQLKTGQRKLRPGHGGSTLPFPVQASGFV